jgi:hypothetical protein
MWHSSAGSEGSVRSIGQVVWTWFDIWRFFGDDAKYGQFLFYSFSNQSNTFRESKDIHYSQKEYASI